MMPEFLEQVMPCQNEFLRVDVIVSRKLDGNCYLVFDDQKMVVVDPSVSYEEVMKHKSLPISAILITHGHIDHFYGLASYINRGIKVYLHRHAFSKLNDPKKNYSFYFNQEVALDLSNWEHEFVHDQMLIPIFSQPFRVLETPGHSNCSVCFLIQDKMFSGDTIFKNNIGRTDLYSGNLAKMLDSLDKINNLNLNYLIYPGHGPMTTLFEEKNENANLLRRANGKNS